MIKRRLLCVTTGCSRGAAFVLAAMTLPLGHAATVWTGPTMNFSKSAATPSDVIIAGKVVLTRGNNQVLYNTAAGETSAGSSSPADTMWAFGALTNYAKLSYQSLASLRNGDLAGRILNQPMVVHLVNEDIYLSVKFTAWAQHLSGGGFAYTRSTPAVSVEPTVSITSPRAGATFAAPASVGLTASVAGGSVTNVEFFAGGTLLGQATATPFSIAGSISAPGSYALTAVATAGGVSATSSVVNITVVAPVPVSMTAPSVGGGLFGFSYSANPGLSYVVQSSANLVDWVSVATNVASSTLVSFSEALTANPSRYYRVGRLPNP
ncbi:MAG: Ig-like domain-containing protein [Limisphaerales bacterium]